MGIGCIPYSLYLYERMIFKMDEQIKCAITHFDKKVTDYQVYVDRELQKQDKQIKSYEDYIVNTLNSASKIADNILKNVAIQETAIGKAITLNDVLNYKHNCSCQLTSDTYEEIIGVSSNLIDLQNDDVAFTDFGGQPHFEITKTVNSNGSAVLNGEIGAYTALRMSVHIEGFEKGKQYTISLRNSNNEQLQFQFLGFAEDGGPTVGWDERYYTNKYTFIWDENTKYYSIDCMYAATDDGIPKTFNNITFYVQIEEGSNMTEWQPAGGEVETKPYIEDFSSVKLIVSNGEKTDEYEPTVNGAVENIESYSPNMEITTDNEHCNIEFKYYVDTKSYIDKKLG